MIMDEVSCKFEMQLYFCLQYFTTTKNVVIQYFISFQSVLKTIFCCVITFVTTLWKERYMQYLGIKKRFYKENIKI